MVPRLGLDDLPQVPSDWVPGLFLVLQDQGAFEDRRFSREEDRVVRGLGVSAGPPGSRSGVGTGEEREQVFD